MLQNKLKAVIPVAVGVIFNLLSLLGVDISTELKAKLSEVLLNIVGLGFMVSGLISYVVKNK